MRATFSSVILFSLFIHTIVASTVFEKVLTPEEDAWRSAAIKKLWDERNRMQYTPLYKFNIAGTPMTDFFYKDETKSPSGTLKHRFVWALVMWALEMGKITANTTVYDSTSGNTGSSEAFMCQLIGVPFVGVISKDLEAEKIAMITRYGGKIVKVETALRNHWAQKLAIENNGFFLNQFGNADSAEEYHESGNYDGESTNVFHEIVMQMQNFWKLPLPHFFVHSAGTGGTISSVGKYAKKYMLSTKIVLVDSQHSLYHDYVLYNKYTNLSSNDVGRPAWVKPGIPGIGYGYNTAPIIFGNTTSLVRSVIDEVARIPDIATVAVMQHLHDTNNDAGASTAFNYLVALSKAIQAGSTGNSLTFRPTERLGIVFIMGDPGSYYSSTYLNDSWIDANMATAGGMVALNCWKSSIVESIKTGSDFMKNDCIS